MKKEAALKIICDCAQTYHEVLEGRNLLFVCAGPNGQISTLETVFTGSNFLHMTGVKFRTVPRLFRQRVLFSLSASPPAPRGF